MGLLKRGDCQQDPIPSIRQLSGWGEGVGFYLGEGRSTPDPPTCFQSCPHHQHTKQGMGVCDYISVCGVSWMKYLTLSHSLGGWWWGWPQVLEVLPTMRARLEALNGPDVPRV